MSSADHPNEILKHTSHRPWPIPNSPWLVTQVWHDLLFAHWPIEAERLRRVVPDHLPLDLYEGRAWVGIVPFWMSGTRMHGMPPVPHLSTCPELNVRTYVTVGGKPGVYFFSLDLPRIVGVWSARAYYKLNYFFADAKVETVEEGVRYRSRRRGGAQAEFEARYSSVGPAEFSKPGSLAEWFTERYCLYAVSKSGRILRANIHHLRWALEPAQAEFPVNTMAAAAGVELSHEKPLLHFARRMRVLIWGREWVRGL